TRAVDPDDDRPGARLRELLERVDAILIVTDEPGDLDSRDVIPACGQHLAAPDCRGKRHHGRNRHQNGDNAPERELAPHAAAVDDQVGIERHVENLPQTCAGHWLPRPSWSMAGSWRGAAGVVNEMEMRVPGAAQHEMVRC